MATQLVEEMSGKWNPADFKDEFRIQVMKLVEKKAKAGEGKTVLEPEEEALQSADVIDLTALLQRSRSEEHTSELQSPCNLVCRLLLEKKKKKRSISYPLTLQLRNC